MLYASPGRDESVGRSSGSADGRRMQTSTHKSTFVQAIKEVLGQSGRSPFALFFPSPAYRPGVRGLYTGLSASIFRQMTYSITRLGAYDALKARLSQDGTFPFFWMDLMIGMRKLSTGEMVLCASGAGALGGLAGNPAGT